MHRVHVLIVPAFCKVHASPTVFIPSNQLFRVYILPIKPFDQGIPGLPSRLTRIGLIKQLNRKVHYHNLGQKGQRQKGDEKNYIYIYIFKDKR